VSAADPDRLREHGGHRNPVRLPARAAHPAGLHNGAIQEVPWGLNTGGSGGVWDAKEAPMLLSAFEYIARGSLLNWWDELRGA
jgi:hypothetical protein